MSIKFLMIVSALGKTVGFKDTSSMVKGTGSALVPQALVFPVVFNTSANPVTRKRVFISEASAVPTGNQL